MPNGAASASPSCSCCNSSSARLECSRPTSFSTSAAGGKWLHRGISSSNPGSSKICSNFLAACSAAVVVCLASLNLLCVYRPCAAAFVACTASQLHATSGTSPALTSHASAAASASTRPAPVSASSS